MFLGGPKFSNWAASKWTFFSLWSYKKSRHWFEVQRNAVSYNPQNSFSTIACKIDKWFSNRKMPFLIENIQLRNESNHDWSWTERSENSIENVKIEWKRTFDTAVKTKNFYLFSVTIELSLADVCKSSESRSSDQFNDNDSVYVMTVGAFRPVNFGNCEICKAIWMSGSSISLAWPRTLFFSYESM